MFIRTMENNEEILQALNEFETMTDADKVLTQDLEDLLSYIAKTGRISFPWNSLKPVFLFKLDKVMREFFESSPSRNSGTSEPTVAADFEIMRHRLLDCLDSFKSAPFTIQRLCELMVEPRKHYNNSDKFMRGVEKNVLVVSTLEFGSDEIAVFGLTNNVDGSHILSNLPNGPFTNGVMTSALATGGNSVTEDGFDKRLVSHMASDCMESHLASESNRLTPLNAQENGFDRQEHYINNHSSAVAVDSKNENNITFGVDKGEDQSLPEEEKGELMATQQTDSVQLEQAPDRENTEGKLDTQLDEKAATDTAKDEQYNFTSFGQSEETTNVAEKEETNNSRQEEKSEPMEEN